MVVADGTVRNSASKMHAYKAKAPFEKLPGTQITHRG
jgi:hypothetical protein